MRAFLEKNPLTAVLLAAGLIRLVSVIWSQGFIHSDDHFDTISVAWDWLHGGMWGSDGYLRWKTKPADTIGRFPLYTLFLLAQMKIAQWLGCSSLNSVMYFIRFVHGLISLLPVWAIYRVTSQVTGSRRWAVAAGLVAGFHFAFPFLGVRSLIEVVGGSFWIAALWFIYRYSYNRKTRCLYFAALFTGLAWMVRFQLAFAILPVPLLLWWESGRFRAAVHYSLGVAAMLLLSGVIDRYLLGRFAGSTLTNLTMNTGLGALYNTVPALYIALLLVFLLPPLSGVALWMAGRLSFLREHRLLVISSALFVFAHMSHPNQQERFIFPIIPAFLLIAVLAVWQYSRDRGSGFLTARWFRWLAGIALVLNLALLVFLTPAYGHRGMVEPMIWFEKNAPTARVLYLQPGVKRWAPSEYGGATLTAFYAKSWDDPDWRLASPAQNLDYYLVYPRREEELPSYLDSLRSRFGDVEEVRRFAPSAYDNLLHNLNPSHNDNYAAFLYRSATK